MDTDPDPRPDLTAAQRIAIALGTAEAPPTDSPTVLPAPVAGVPDLPAAPPARAEADRLSAAVGRPGSVPATPRSG